MVPHEVEHCLVYVLDELLLVPSQANSGAAILIQFEADLEVFIRFEVHWVKLLAWMNKFQLLNLTGVW